MTKTKRKKPDLLPSILNDLRGQGYAIEKQHVLRDLRALQEHFTQLVCNDNSRDGR